MKGAEYDASFIAEALPVFVTCVIVKFWKGAAPVRLRNE